MQSNLKKYIYITPLLLVMFFIDLPTARATVFLENTATLDTSRTFGGGTGTIKFSLEYTPLNSETICNIYTKVRRVGNPSDGIKFSIYSGGSDPESGIFLRDTTTVPGSSLNEFGPDNYIQFVISPCLAASAGTKFNFVLKRTGGETSTAYNLRESTASNGMTGAKFWLIAQFTSWAVRPAGGEFMAVKLDDTGAPSPNMAFTSPPEATSFPLNYEIPFDGDCPENGANKIRFTNPPYVPSEGYEIDCVSNRFSFSLPARDYGNYFLELYSQSYDTAIPAGQSKYYAGIHYTVDPEYNEWIMNLNYPRCGQNDCIHFALNPSTNFPLRWAYKVPPSATKSQITYRFREYTDQTFQALKSGGVSFSDNLAHLLTTSDKPELEFHHNHMVVTNGVTQYYKAELIYNNVVKVFHLFVVTGDNSNNGQVPTLPSIILGGCSNNQIMAALCDVFIPSSEFFTNKFNYLNQLLITKTPFSYFMALKDKFANVSTTTTDGYFINTTLATAGAHPISVNFQAFNTADSNINIMLNNFKPYMVALLWLGFASYALTRVYRLFKPI